MRIVRSSTNNPELNKLLGLPPIHFIILEGDEKEPEPGVLPDSCLCILREVKTYSVSGLFFKRKEEIIHYRIHWIAKEFEAYTSAGGYRISYAAGSVIGETKLDGLREIMLDRDYTLHLLEGIYRNTKQLSDASVENVYETVTSQTTAEIIRRRNEAIRQKDTTQPLAYSVELPLDYAEISKRQEFVENVYDIAAKQTAADLLREQTSENITVPEETVEEPEVIPHGSIVEVSDSPNFPEWFTYRRILAYHNLNDADPFWVFDCMEKTAFRYCRVVSAEHIKISERDI